MLLAGCGAKAFVRPSMAEHPPRRVAVLPFAITYPYDLAVGEAIPKSHEIGRDAFQRAFYHMFVTYGYEDVTPAEVAARLSARWGALDTAAWRGASAQELGAALGVDAVVYGDISRLVYVATPLYTEGSIDAVLRMVDATTGETLWSQRAHAAERGGALMQKGQVVDFIKDQFESAHADRKFRNVADQAVARAVKKLPDPMLESAVMPANPSGRPWVAILPFEASEKDQRGAAVLRRHLAAALQEGPLALVELQAVSALVKRQAPDWTEGAVLPIEASPQAVSGATGAPLVLRGQVTQWGRRYIGLQSWVMAGLRLELVDGATGEVVWSAEDTNSRTAGILKGPTGYKSLVTAPLSGLKTKYLHGVARDLAHRMAEQLLAAPAVQARLAAQPASAAAPLADAAATADAATTAPQVAAP
jgi:hypothetical protein